MYTDYTALYEAHHNHACMHIMSCINNIIVVGEDKALPGVVGIKTTVGNRRHWILSLDVHSVKNKCVCTYNINFNNSMYSVCKDGIIISIQKC